MREDKKEILDDVERRYLWNIIKPFRDKVTTISKNLDWKWKKPFICIRLKKEVSISLPYFRGGMYEGMEANKKYTLEELGL